MTLARASGLKEIEQFHVVFLPKGTAEIHISVISGTGLCSLNVRGHLVMLNSRTDVKEWGAYA